MQCNHCLELTKFLALALVLAGCSTPESRIKSNPQAYASLSPADQELVREGKIRVGLSRAAVFLAWGKPDRVRYGVRQGHPFEVWIYTTSRSAVLPSYYYPGLYGFGYFRGGTWVHHHHFYSIGLYSYPFDPYPEIISYEVPYKMVYFEGDQCTGFQYLGG